MDDGRKPRQKTTVAAAIAIFVVTVPFLIDGIGVARYLGNPEAMSEEVSMNITLLHVGRGPNELANYVRIVSGILLLACALSIFVGIGVLRRREGAVHAGVALFALMSVIAIGTSLSGLAADPPESRARFGILVGIVDALIVYLLLRRSTLDDVNVAEWERKQAKAERKAKRTARK
jgi:hypothetical protein